MRTKSIIVASMLLMSGIVTGQVTNINYLANEFSRFFDSQSTISYQFTVEHNEMVKDLSDLDAPFEVVLLARDMRVMAGPTFTDISYLINGNMIERTNHSITYSCMIPAGMLPNGRYSIDFLVTFKSTGRSFSLNDFIVNQPTLTIGSIGIRHAAFHYKVSDAYATDYAFLQEGNYLPSFPERLGGIYTNGFCSNELIRLEDLEVRIWKNKHVGAANLDILIATDESEDFVKLPLSLKLSGTVQSNYFPDQIPFGHPEWEEKIYMIDQISGDLLELVDFKPGEHSIRFFFSLKSDETEIRLPENGFFESSYTIANVPVGADCQAALLPIELLDFLVLSEQNQVYLKWISAIEINNQFYVIERSKDVKYWETIHEVQGQGNSSGYVNYTYLDKYPFPGISYYRLRQMDFDGSLSYSKVKTVRITDSSIQLYPNPVDDYLFYKIEDPDQQYDIKIYDLTGSCVYQTTIPDPADQFHRIDLNNLPKGSYIIKYIHADNYLSRTSKFIKL